jgi:hypothetical protein
MGLEAREHEEIETRTQQGKQCYTNADKTKKGGTATARPIRSPTWREIGIGPLPKKGLCWHFLLFSCSCTSR